jgi:protein SCO1
MRRAGSWLVWLGLCVLAGCGGAREYPARGVVFDVNREMHQVVIDHEDIPGLMPAMTMSFDVPDAELLERLEKGQAIEFTVAFDGESYRVVEARVVAEGAETGGAGFAGLADAADVAPAFALIDQSGRRVTSQELRGRTLLVDFVYTHCPGPCPIQTSREVRVQRLLPEALRDEVRFVSISLDPVRDTPEALRAYAEARGADLANWSFLTGPEAEVAEVVRAFGVGSTLAPDGEIEHMLVTFVVDPEGRVAERFLGLEVPAETIAEEVERVARR